MKNKAFIFTCGAVLLSGVVAAVISIQKKDNWETQLSNARYDHKIYAQKKRESIEKEARAFKKEKAIEMEERLDRIEESKKTQLIKENEPRMELCVDGLEFAFLSEKDFKEGYTKYKDGFFFVKEKDGSEAKIKMEDHLNECFEKYK
jgi:hypothetical protein